MKLKLYTPYDKQLPIHKACNDKETFFITVNAGRQVGKTLLTVYQAIYWAMTNKNILVYWVSPSAPQYLKVYKQMLSYIIDTPVIKSYKGSMGDCEIIFDTGSVVKFRSALSGDHLKGETVEYIVLDECASMKQLTIQEVLIPMLSSKGRKMIAVGTPKGKNYFYNLYMKGNGDNHLYKSFKFKSSDNPFNKQFLIDDAKKSFPPALFAQEFLGEFIDEAAVFQNVNELATMKLIDKPKQGDSYFAGIDIALKDDYTVITLINQKFEVVYYDRFNNTTAPILKERLIKTINLFKPKKIMIELNNQGLPIYDDLKDIHKVKNLIGFNTTATSKPEIVNNLINAFSNSKLKIPNVELYKDELKMFTMEMKNGKAKFAAPLGFNDDIPMSLAITWYCVNKYLYTGQIAFT